MSEPEAKLVACIGCGTLNPPDAAACSGCGHAFGGPAARPPGGPTRVTPPPRPAPGPAPNPYEPPATPLPQGPGLRIGTVMVLVAVVAVCLAAFLGDIGWGIFVTVGVLPPSVWVALASARRGREGRPMRAGEAVKLFFVAAVLTYLISCASLIAFVATCAPIGLASENMPAAFGVGGLAALATAIGCTRVVVRVTRHMADARSKRQGPRAG